MEASVLAERVSRIQTAASIDIADQAKKRILSGEDVVDFSWGEPDFDTPLPVKSSCKAALDKNLTHYSASRGIENLRAMICDRFKYEQGVAYSKDVNVLIAPGAKQAIFYAFFALLDPGDEVIVPEPYWLSYRDSVELAGGRLVGIPCGPENGFRVLPGDVEKRITKRTKVFLLNNPCNPTGVLLNKRELEAIASVVRKSGITVIADEIYGGLVFDARPFVSFASIPGMQDSTIVVNGFSKTYAMTGWRLGYMLADKLIIDALNKVHQHIATCAGTFIQYAAVEALSSCDAPVETMRLEYEKRRDRMVAMMRSIPALSCLKPDATFYCWIDVRKTGYDSIGFSRFLLERAKIACVPGNAYGKSGEGYVRFAFTQSIPRIEEGMERIRRLFL